ncbi:MAG: hypothetical protein QOC92_3215 [Acidimicrobiaceae bacterium]
MEFELRLPQELPIEEGHFLDMAFIYHEAELIRALKPYALRHLVEAHHAPAMYLAPEVAVYAPLDDGLSPSRADGVVLVPHATVPFPDDGRSPTVFDMLGRGVFDAGLVAVGPAATDFLDYWSGHLYLDCVFEPQNLAWGDQRWLDPVPVMFPTDIVHDVGVQVADWNLHARRLEAGPLVDGQPVRTFHFRGFDPDRPHLLDAAMGQRPRILLSEHDALAALCDQRRRELLDLGWATARAEAYGWTHLDDGTLIDDRMRRVYRMALKAGERPPVAFGPGSAKRVLTWLASPAVASAAPRPSRYLTQVWFERVDLHAAFPDPDGEHTDAFLAWAREHGHHEAAIPDALVPPPPPADLGDRRRLPGVNLAGYVRAVLGLGEAARLLLLGLEVGSIPHVVVSAAGTQNEQSIEVELTSPNNAPFDTTVACVTADQLEVFAREVGPALLADRYVIGFWFWENEQITPAMRRGLELVDEIWVASDFCAEVFRAHTTKPVIQIPLAVIPPASGASRRDLGLPEDRFLFLNSFDFLSTFERKNPLGVVHAFADAFGPDDGPMLVVKSINGDKRMREREELRLAAKPHPHIVLLEDYVTADEQAGLLLAADCFVSLHRAEGFGLGLAQCMALGKPAIATAWSGNLAFMTADNSWLVPHTMTTVGPDALPYPADAQWAEPQVDAAAAAMREVVYDRSEAEHRGERARRDLAERHSATRSGDAMRHRLEAIRTARAASVNDGKDRGKPRTGRFRRSSR